MTYCIYWSFSRNTTCQWILELEKLWQNMKKKKKSEKAAKQTKNILERLFQVEMPYFIHGFNILSEQYKCQNLWLTTISGPNGPNFCHRKKKMKWLTHTINSDHRSSLSCEQCYKIWLEAGRNKWQSNLNGKWSPLCSIWFPTWFPICLIHLNYIVYGFFFCNYKKKHCKDGLLDCCWHLLN